MNLRQTRIGFVLMIVAALLLPIVDSLSKILTADFAPLQIVWARNFFHLLLFAPFALWQFRRTGFRVRRPVLHLLRAVCFVCMSLFYVAALRIIPLVDAQTLVFVFPLILIALSIAVLGETVTAAVWLAGVMGLIGAAIVIGPGGTVDMRGGILSLGAAGATATYMLLNRKLADGGPVVLMILPPLFGTVVLAVVLAVVLPGVWIAPSISQWGLMAATGASFAFIHGLIILAFVRVAASRLAPLAYFQMISGVGLGYFVFGDWPTIQVWAGLVLIVTAGLMVQRRRQ